MRIGVARTKLQINADRRAAEGRRALGNEMRRLREDAGLSKAAVAAGAVVALLWLVAAISPLFAERASEIRLEDRLRPPSLAHPFGTDDLGREIGRAHV